jgi:hypothetical protein
MVRKIMLLMQYNTISHHMEALEEFSPGYHVHMRAAILLFLAHSVGIDGGGFHQRMPCTCCKPYPASAKS